MAFAKRKVKVRGDAASSRGGQIPAWILMGAGQYAHLSSLYQSLLIEVREKRVVDRGTIGKMRTPFFHCSPGSDRHA